MSIGLIPPWSSQTALSVFLGMDSKINAPQFLGMALNEKGEVALLDRIPADSRLCTVRLGGWCKTNNRRSDSRSLFVVSACALAGCSSHAIKDKFYQKLRDFLRTPRRSYIVSFVENMNSRVRRMSSNDVLLRSSFGLDSGRLEPLLIPVQAINCFSKIVSRRSRRCTTWCPPSSSYGWTQIDETTICYKWPG